MTLCEKAQDIRLRTEQSLQKIADLARYIEPLLRDLNHQNTADRLAGALGEYDVMKAESEDFARTHLQELIAVLLSQKDAEHS